MRKLQMLWRLKKQFWHRRAQAGLMGLFHLPFFGWSRGRHYKSDGKGWDTSKPLFISILVFWRHWGMGSQPGPACQAASEGEGPRLGSLALVLRLRCGGWWCNSNACVRYKVAVCLLPSSKSSQALAAKEEWERNQVKSKIKEGTC